jgi:hypothetical protein
MHFPQALACSPPSTPLHSGRQRMLLHGSGICCEGAGKALHARACNERLLSLVT